MAQPPHFEITRGIYFVTSKLNEDVRWFDGMDLKIIQHVIFELIKEEEETFPPSIDLSNFSGLHTIIYAYVIMPNHIHLLIKPSKDGISKAMQLIKGRSSRHINRGIIWQKGFFDFTLFSEKMFKKKFNYIHNNPVRWGLVERAEDYKYSSANAYKIKYGVTFYA